MKMTLHTKATLALLLWTLAFASYVFAGGPASKPASSKEEGAAAVVHTTDADTMRIQGEQRFHANCGRCHATPEKFPPRIMKTVLRHMRVRATITDEDMRVIVFYVTQ